jgi:serine/threonine protein kinase
LSQDIQIGQLLDKRFEITALIERGGMSTVFKALDLHTGGPAVLKVPHAEFEGSRANSSRFAREAAIIGKLDHPGILKIFPVAEKSRPYVAMEYLEGETLSEILGRARPLPECLAVQLASRLCGILEYMHRHGVVHRDVKPGNIMISDDGSPHLIDFGIAKAPAMEAFTLGWSSPNMGTPEYMSPEQIRGDRVDAQTDIYSLGVVLYEIVTGTRPFQGATTDEIFNARLAGDPRPPRELNNNLSEQIEEIILHAMAPNPSDRYCSAAAMKAELDSPENVQVTGMYMHPRKPNPWPKRLRLAGVIMALAASPVVLFFFFLLMFQRQLAR